MLKQDSRFLLGLCIILFLFINILTIKDGHSWGADAFQYIQQAKNIVEHKEYSSGLPLDIWVIYPPGFPLLLAPLIKMFGLNFKVFKLLNVFFWLFFALTLYPIMRKRLGDEKALLSTIILLSLPLFFLFKQNVLSDVPALFFLTFSVYTYTKYCELVTEGPARARKLFLLISIVSMIFAALVRYVGIFIFFCVIGDVLVNKRDKRILIFIIFAILLVLWVQSLAGASMIAHIKEIKGTPFQVAHGIYNNISSVIGALVVFLVPIPKGFIPAIFVASPLILLISIGFFIYRLQKHTITFLDIYFIVYLLGAILWPLDIQDTPRYALPLVGVALIFSLETFTFLWDRLLRGKFKNTDFNFDEVIKAILLFIIFMNVVNISLLFNFNDDGILKEESIEMIEWVKNNTRIDEHFMFKYPSALGLLADRVGAQFVILKDKDFLYSRIRRFSADYLINIKEIYPLNFEKLSDEGFIINKVWENKVYEIYKVQRVKG